MNMVSLRLLLEIEVEMLNIQLINKFGVQEQRYKFENYYRVYEYVYVCEL